HQDYGYWYKNGCLYPYMASAMMAIDRNTKENGCLQVLAGSHHLGRVDHVKVGDQTGADPERVDQAAKSCPLVYCEMEPGTVLFFHCNLLHRSDQNKSDRPRWTYIMCYNAARNDPYKEHHHPNYHPLIRVPDTAIKDVARKSTSHEGKAVST
ncbi:MAG: phytanoyl-CoA dioxygenase family protein, partial [Planctomycetia bacterium]